MINTNAAAKDVRFIWNNQGVAIIAVPSRFTVDMAGKPLPNIRFVLHGAPINGESAAHLFSQFCMSSGSYAFRVTKSDPAHKIGGGIESLWAHIKSLGQDINIFRGRTQSPHTLTYKSDSKAN